MTAAMFHFASLNLCDVQVRAWNVNPLVSPWLLFPGALIAIAAVSYLYTAQKRVASARLVHALTILRVMLILLISALLLAPSRQWAIRRHSNGTLWLLLDQSLSMRQTDPQTTARERLRWAEALGELPADMHPPGAGATLCGLIALRDGLAHLRRQFEGSPDQRTLDEREEDLSAWRRQLSSIGARLAGDPATASFARNAEAISQSLQDQPGVALKSAQDDMDRMIVQLEVVARKAENTFIQDHANDERLKAALAKGTHRSRADLAYAAITSHSARGLRSLVDAMARPEVRIVPIGGAGASSLVEPAKADLPSILRRMLANPAGTSTNISAALKYVGTQLSPDSTVLIVSDGRQNVGGTAEETARFLASRGTRVFALTVGAHQVARDAAVDQVDAPDWIFAGDDLLIAPTIRLDGLDPGEQATVELRRGNELVQQKTIWAEGDPQQRVRLEFRDKPAGGTFDYSVVIRPMPHEAVAGNNRQTVRVAVRSEKVRVLLVEDEPRWEYQFLRNYLLRDRGVKLQTVLLEPGRIENVEAPAGIVASPDRDDGQADAQSLPRTAAEWSRFDIVILGDVPPERLAPERQKNLSQSLRDGGVKGLMLIAGPRNMPERYAGTAMAELMPVELSGNPWTPLELEDHLHHGFRPSPAPEALGSILGRFSQDAGTNSDLWSAIPAWYWHSRWTPARPGATVLWSIGDSTAAPSSAVPDSPEELQRLRSRALLATMNFGLGRVMYLAGPETWRLRYVEPPGADPRVEDLHRRFWGQAIRWAVGSELPAGGKFVRFGADKHSYVGGEPIIVTARVLDQDFTPLQGQTIRTVATRKDGSVAGEAAMVHVPAEGAGAYRGTLYLPPGAYRLGLRGAQVERLLAADSEPFQKTIEIEVQPDAIVEDRDVNTDYPRMAAIARAGEGVALDGPYFDALAEALPVVDRIDVTVNQAGLFSNPDDVRTRYAHWAFFGLFVALITTEWVLRKRGGLI